MHPILLLGPQKPVPNLRPMLDALDVGGPIGVVSAGWQEREGELDELGEHIRRPVVDLALYARAEEVFARDRALFDDHRERQDRLKLLQRYHRIRLAHARAAARELFAADEPDRLMQTERRLAINALRHLDRQHLGQIRCIHADYRRRWPLEHHPELRRHRSAMAESLSRCAAVLIAGGHVAVLISRLRLFDFQTLAADRPVVAWSGGAMALAERIVLFHDHPPHGAGDAEVFDLGLGLVPRMVLLPHAQARLSLDDPERVSLFARRFAPAVCAGLENGSGLRWNREQLESATGVSRLCPSGEVAELRP